MSKKLPYVFINIGFALLAGYLVISFIKWNLNVALWGVAERFVFLIVSTTFGLLYTLEERAVANGDRE